MCWQRFINWGPWTPRGSLEGAGKEKIDKVMMKNAMQMFIATYYNSL